VVTSWWRSLSFTAALGLAVATLAVIPASATPAPTVPPSPSPPPGPFSEGPAGPPLLMPGEHAAAPPAYASPVVTPGCPAAPHGPSYYAPGKRKTVALTFDDGPGRSTDRIRAVLRHAGVTATFFNLGENAAARPAQVRGEARAGYLLGNHTWDHRDLTTMAAARQAREIDQESAEQKRLVGAGPCLFRPPYGSYNSTTLRLTRHRHLRVWMWSVDTEDWKANGSSSRYWVNRIIRLAKQEGGALRHPVVLMHNQPAGNPATVRALPGVIRYFRSHGYRFVDLFGRTGTGYLVVSSNGEVRRFGALRHGSMAGKLPAGVTSVGLAADSFTGGYWILESDGGVNNFRAPWYGNIRNKLPHGTAATAIAGARGGYLVLSSNGAVHNFGTRWYGSDAGKLPRGVTAVGLAADPATGGYWILKSKGGVDNFHAPRHRSLAGHLPPGVTVSSIAAGPAGGYLVLTSNGGVHNFGTRWYGSDAGKLPNGVTAVGLAASPATGGYWILASNGGIGNFHAPWHGSLAGKHPAGTAPRAIAGQ
jgi:peptidoglycan-N-acetylglucosamine deacetylase